MAVIRANLKRKHEHKKIWSKFNKNVDNKVVLSLKEGASDEDLKKLEQTLNFKLPFYFIELYKIQNGLKDTEEQLLFSDIWELMNIDDIEVV